MSTSTTRRPRRYRIDWVQLVAALVMLASYAAVIVLCFAPVPPAPASTPAMLVCLGSTTVWLARREEHDGGEDL
ncbi:hypothetical protein HMPREF1317_0304 [Schaalia georgiae F0490]|jgi:hypothetical protein|uniref:Uncharacterized protein n=1 Tax=Schaalia georgiae F0490 TaxID=1125717 RepID=J0WGY4_9ACTO|nr:hypothetical protein [Schaalia georgiae]EJF35821.1 hypothetical protein HMPREF1317_0304 [Schaalia georgiae F0490]